MDIKMSNVAEDTMMRRNAFLETDNEKLVSQLKELKFDCAELQRDNEQMREKIKTLATPTPEWTKGYKQTRKNYKKKAHFTHTMLEDHLPPGNKRITNCIVSLAGKTKPCSAAYSPPLRVRLHFALSGFIFPARLTKQLVIR